MPLVDYLVLVPLEQEWGAARQVLSAGRDATEIPDGTLTYWSWAQPVTTRQFAGDYLVVATPMALWTPGPALTAAVTTKALARWQPARVILVGIAGSIEPNTARLGDVVVAAEVYGYEVSDERGATEKLRPTFNQPGAADLNRAITFKGDAKAYSAWQTACLADAATHGLDGVVKQPPQMHLGVIGSGTRVVQSVEFGQRLKDEINKWIVAVEMEARGVHQAVYLDGHRSDALTVRGISDYADLEKEKLEKASKDGWRTWAASNAARFVHAMLGRGTLPPISTSYALNLHKGPHKRFNERDVPHFAFRHEGSQSIVFDALLQHAGPTPDLELRVVATNDDGTPATGFVGVCMVETPVKGATTGVQLPGGGLKFDLPASDWGLYVELLTSFSTPVREITVSCRDDFGRGDTKTLNLTPTTQRGTP